MNPPIDLLAKLVSMPTITADATANELALDYAEMYLTERGMHCSRLRYDGRSALAASSHADNHKRPTVALAAHLDVVPADEAQFTLQEKDGKLYGRGVYDMKFAAAGYLQVVDDLARAGTLQDFDFGIMLTTDEEASHDSGVKQLVAAGFHPAVAILPDSTAPGWEIEETSKGWWRFNLIATGRAVHSARPWEGESASIKLIHALHELKEIFKDQSPATDTLNIGSIHGEGVYNQVPDHMVAMVEIRLVNEASYPSNKKLVEALCKKHEVNIEPSSLVQPVHPILDHPLVHTYRDAVEKITDKRPANYISLGGSDAPYFTDAGIPCILSCPLGGGHHTADEWLDKQSFGQFVPILHEYLQQTAHHSAAASVDTAAKLV